jgi:hypothetical protein
MSSNTAGYGSVRNVVVAAPQLVLTDQGYLIPTISSIVLGEAQITHGTYLSSAENATTRFKAKIPIQCTLDAGDLCTRANTQKRN